jgi:alpha-beta hydrolase superfamily lysophospholipase
MSEPWIVALIILGVIGFYLVTCMIIVLIGDQKVLGSRGKDPENPCFLRYEDYQSELSRTPYVCGYFRKAIRGYVYQEKGRTDFKGFIILSHGMFGTHQQYFLDISLLCSHGYQVLAYDQYGVGLSDGTSEEYLAHGIYVCENVLHDVLKRNVNQGLPILLYGHSWGAYSVMGAMRNYPQVRGVISRSSPINPVWAAWDLLLGYSKPLAFFLAPTFPLCCFLLMKTRYSISAKRGPKKNKTTPVLLIQAKNDPMVHYRHSLAHFYEKHGQTNLEVFLTDKGLHNSLLSEEGYRNYTAAVKEYKRLMAENSLVRDDDVKAFVAGLDRKSMYPYHEEVKEAILSFADRCVTNKK